ncbi:MAG TPA: hypothetical protein VN181_16355, partial [Thermoanaerobaculia bacterium]|nr:hypothetical protein [Thermoanaerobaculia bacterium]
ANPSSIVTSRNGKFIAVLDAFAQRAAVVSAVDGAVTLHETITSTPNAAAFFGSDLWIALRDRSSVVRITLDGTLTEVAVARDPAFVTVTDDFVYVYSRAGGRLQEIDPARAVVTRSVAAATAGSDLEILPPKPGAAPGATAYLCRPQDGTIATFDLTKMESKGTMNVTGAPIDLAFVPFGAQLPQDPGTPLIIDLRKDALIVAHAAVRHPSTIDRVFVTAAGVFTYDSVTGSVYRLEGRAPVKIASGQTTSSFVATDEALFTWDAQSAKPRRQP